MNAVDDPKLPLRLKRADQRIDPAIVTAQPSMLGAIKLCVSAAGFESDKQVYGELGIDAGHWSRITRGDAHFPVDKLPELMRLCGNEAPLVWLVNACGYAPASLRKRETETERALRAARERVAALENDKRVLIEALRGSNA